MKAVKQLQFSHLANTWENLSRIVRRFGSGAAILLIVAFGAATSRAANFYPATTADLLNAIQQAEGNGQDDVIYLKISGVYKLTVANNSVNGLPKVTTKIRIVGNGAVIERDSSSPLFRFFENSGDLTLENLTLRGGKVATDGGAVVNYTTLNSTGTLTLTGCVFENNSVDGYWGSWSGGAVLNRYGTVKIDRCTFRNNTAPNGGGLSSVGTYDGNTSLTANLTVTNSSFVNNRAAKFYNAGLNVYYGGAGGGFALYGAHNANVISVTVAGNKADLYGGGIALYTLAQTDGNQNPLSAKFRNLTVASNRATSLGGGIYWNACGADSCPVALEPEVANSLIANNIAPSNKNYDTNHGFNSNGHNVVGPGNGSFGVAQFDTNGTLFFTPNPTDKFIGGSVPQLNGQNNNGDAGSEHLAPMAPVNTSLLIDKADPSFCPALDQLGYGRVGVCDIGAVEYRPCTAPLSEMTAWWAFDSYFTLEDIATWSVPNHAAPVANAPLQVPGMVGGAVRFTNASQVLEVPSQDDINFYNGCAGDGGAAFSIDAWVKTAATGTQVILDKRQFGSNGIPKGYHLFVYYGRLGFQLATGTSYSNDLTPVPTSLNKIPDLSDNQWHFVAITVYVRCQRNGSAYEGKMYIDGQLVQTFAPLANDYSNNAPLRIGGHSSSPAMFFNGSLDEIEFFQRTLDASEIQALYNAGWAGKCGKKAPPPCGGDPSTC